MNVSGSRRSNWARHLASAAAFAASYVAAVMLAVWLTIVRPCRGDPKFGVCDGLDFYTFVWSLEMSPVAVIALLLALWPDVNSHRLFRMAVLFAACVFGLLYYRSVNWDVVRLDLRYMYLVAGVIIIVSRYVIWQLERRDVRT